MSKSFVLNAADFARYQRVMAMRFKRKIGFFSVQFALHRKSVPGLKSKPLFRMAQNREARACHFSDSAGHPTEMRQGSRS